MSFDKDINFETAKAAKLRGLPQRDYEQGYDANGQHCSDFALDTINGHACYAITTQGEIIAWLRKEHKLHLTLELQQDSAPYVWIAHVQDTLTGWYTCEETYTNMDYDEIVDEILEFVLFVYLGNLL